MYNKEFFEDLIKGYSEMNGLFNQKNTDNLFTMVWNDNGEMVELTKDDKFALKALHGALEIRSLNTTHYAGSMCSQYVRFIPYEWIEHVFVLRQWETAS